MTPDLDFTGVLLQNNLFYAVVEVPFHGIKKNSKKIAFNRATGNRFITSSDRAKQAQNHLTSALQYEKKSKWLDTITCDVNARFTFYFPEAFYFTKKGERSKKLADLSNLYELPQDVMQDVGIIENDSLIESHDGSSRKPIKGHKFWLEIELSKKTLDS